MAYQEYFAMDEYKDAIKEVQDVLTKHGLYIDMKCEPGDDTQGMSGARLVFRSTVDKKVVLDTSDLWQIDSNVLDYIEKGIAKKKRTDEAKRLDGIKRSMSALYTYRQTTLSFKMYVTQELCTNDEIEALNALEDKSYGNVREKIGIPMYDRIRKQRKYYRDTYGGGEYSVDEDYNWSESYLTWAIMYACGVIDEFPSNTRSVF